jgi:hypothetical protein
VKQQGESMLPETSLCIAAIVVFALLGVFCLWRGLLKFRKAKELEVEPRFRKIAHFIRYVGWFMLLLAAGCAGAVVVILTRFL